MQSRCAFIRPTEICRLPSSGVCVYVYTEPPASIPHSKTAPPWPPQCTSCSAMHFLLLVPDWMRFRHDLVWGWRPDRTKLRRRCARFYRHWERWGLDAAPENISALMNDTQAAVIFVWPRFIVPNLMKNCDLPLFCRIFVNESSGLFFIVSERKSDLSADHWPRLAPPY